MDKNERRLINISGIELRDRNNLMDGSYAEKILKKDPHSKTTSKAYFYHYTTSRRALCILERSEILGESCFLVSDLTSMNDLMELDQHRDEAGAIFALCFSQQREENIPLWYLYGGIGGKGARIGLTPSKMIRFIDGIDTVYPAKKKNNGRYEADPEHPLKKDQDFTLECGWIYYCKTYGKDDDESVEKIMYRNELYCLEDDYRIFKEKNYFIKVYPWNYEEEFRIIFKFETPPAEKIVLPFSVTNLAKNRGMSLMFAPNAEKTEEEILDIARKTGISGGQIRNSKLHVKLDLLNRNREEIAEKVKETIIQW